MNTFLIQAFFMHHRMSHDFFIKFCGHELSLKIKCFEILNKIRSWKVLIKYWKLPLYDVQLENKIKWKSQSARCLSKHMFRGGSRTAATSKVELFVIIVNGWKLNVQKAVHCFFWSLSLLDLGFLFLLSILFHKSVFIQYIMVKDYEMLKHTSSFDSS